MIRQATAADLDAVTAGYLEHFAHERTHVAYTVFKEGVYPTRKNAEQALQQNGLYISEEHGVFQASIIVSTEHSEEYANVDWPSHATPEQVLVIHLLMVRPSLAGRGIGSSMVNYVCQLAKERGCKAVRLDTGSQNTPAVALYTKLGFAIVGTGSMQIGGAIAHNGHLFLEKQL